MFGLDGSLRSYLFLLGDNHDVPLLVDGDPDAISQTILRLTALGRPHPRLSYEVQWVADLAATTREVGPAVETPFLLYGIPRYRVVDASWQLLDRENVASTSSLDRFNIKYSLDRVDIIIGRHAITFGKAYFWNPLDVFFSFAASQIDREFKPGVDALRIDVPLGLFSGLSLIGAAGARLDARSGDLRDPAPRDADWYGSAVLGRVFTNFHNWDLALQGGKIYGGFQLGAGIVGDLGPVQLRAELARFWARQSDPLPFPLQGDQVVSGFTAVAGVGRRFDNSLSLDLEYLFNGMAEPDQLDANYARSLIGSCLQVGRHLVGLLASYEFSPLVFGQLAVIGSVPDPSAMVQPLVRVSLADEMELLLGMNLSLGPGPAENIFGIPRIQSEFGTFPHSAFLEWKAYF